jgi:hypothetical protein
MLVHWRRVNASIETFAAIEPVPGEFS